MFQLASSKRIAKIVGFCGSDAFRCYFRNCVVGRRSNYFSSLLRWKSVLRSSKETQGSKEVVSEIKHLHKVNKISRSQLCKWTNCLWHREKTVRWISSLTHQVNVKFIESVNAERHRNQPVFWWTPWELFESGFWVFCREMREHIRNVRFSHQPALGHLVVGTHSKSGVCVLDVKRYGKVLKEPLSSNLCF